jgi:hypothetical protein
MFPFRRRTSPAARFQMIDFSAIDNSLPEVNVDPHERDYEPDCERPGIVAPGLVTRTVSSVAPVLGYAHAILRHDYSHCAHGNALKWA